MCWVIDEVLAPVEAFNIGIAQHSACGKRDTSEDEDIIV